MRLGGGGEEGGGEGRGEARGEARVVCVVVWREGGALRLKAD